ncbi:hypothetical protein MAR_020369, partial [Mya arenaria]
PAETSRLNETPRTPCQAKQRLTSMKESFVKRCRSIKKKVTNIRDKSSSNSQQSMEEQHEMSHTTTTTTSSSEQAAVDREAWVRSPVRTRAQARQLELRRESLRAKINAHRVRAREPVGSREQFKQSKMSKDKDHDSHSLEDISDRLDLVEQRVCELETAIPHELAEWKNLGMKFRYDYNETKERSEDDVYVVPEYPSIISQDQDITGHMVHENDHMEHENDHMVHENGHMVHKIKPEMYSPATSLNEDSLPSGIPNRLLLNVQNNSMAYTAHQTSTPVTAREISFRSASKQYDRTNQILHTNITTISVDHSFSDKHPSEPVLTKTEAFPDSYSAVRDRKSNYEFLDTVDGREALYYQKKYDKSPLNEYRNASNEPKGESEEKVLSPEQIAVKRFLQRRSSAQHSVSFQDENDGSLRRENRKRSNSRSPQRSLTQSPSPKCYSPTRKQTSSFTRSPPMASSTFREDNGHTNTSAMQSPVSFTFRHDPEDSKNNTFAKIELDESGLVGRRHGTSRDRSSGSDLSTTFVTRNDSQMVYTNNSEDLPGYVRHRSFPASQMHDERANIDSSENEADMGNKMVVEADIEIDAPRERVRLPMGERSGATSVTYTDDGLSLTTVTEFTGDYINSFAESSDHSNRSRWTNKDVFMFQRERMKPQLKSVYERSRENIDETGDGKKPPLPTRKSTDSDDTNNQINFLKEAERRLAVFNNRKSGEDATAGVCLEKLPREHIGASYYLETGEIQEHFKETAIYPHASPKLQCSPQNQRSPKSVSVDKVPKRLSPTDFLPSETDENPDHCYGVIKKSPSLKRSPNKQSPSLEKRQSPSSKHSSPKKSPNRLSGSQISIARHADSTREFEFLERQLHDDSLIKKSGISLSMSHLPEPKGHPHLGIQRQKSISCTNSVDGDTRSIISESARYHFLHDKGMIKISSPSLKLMNGSPASQRKHSPQCANIDEESDIVESGSESGMSGVYVNNRFSIPSLNGGKTSSEIDSKHTRSEQAHSEMTVTVSESQSHATESEINGHENQELENSHLEEFLKIADEQNGNWDNVLGWMNSRYHGDNDEEYEQELDELVEQHRAELELVEQHRAEHELVEQERPELEMIQLHRAELDLVDQHRSELQWVQESKMAACHQNGSQSNLYSPDEDSVYYSFLGQSDELKNALSPMNGSKVYLNNGVRNKAYSDEKVSASLMYTIMNGNVRDVARLLNSDKTISEGEIKEATVWAVQNQIFDITLLLLEDICKLIRATEEDDLIEVYPAYLENRRWEPVFVILTKEKLSGKWDSFMGFPVYRRRFDSLSDEATQVMNNSFVQNYSLTAEELKTVKNAVTAADLKNKHSKITIINACPCRSVRKRKKLEKGLCIAIHCQIKGFIPFDEEPFPKEINRIPVDVREGYCAQGVTKPNGLIDLQQQLWDLGIYTSDETETSDGQRSTRSRSTSQSSRSSECKSGSDTGDLDLSRSGKGSAMSVSVATLHSDMNNNEKDQTTVKTIAGDKVNEVIPFHGEINILPEVPSAPVSNGGSYSLKRLTEMMTDEVMQKE